MQTFLIFVHIVAAVFLVLLILLQHGKGGGLSGLFGGGSGMDDILTSPSSDVFLKKATITLAVMFFLTSLILAVRTSKEPSRSLLENQPVPSPVQRPLETSEELPSLPVSDTPAEE